MRSLAFVSFTACAFGTPLAAQSQALNSEANTVTTPGEQSGDEIVVTASKGASTRLSETPFAIQAVSGRDIGRTGTASFLDVASKFPGLTVDSEGPGDSRYIIRGIYAVGEGTTGVYYDETIITGGNAFYGDGMQADIRGYDLDRIEVLRGPQGTLYGASSMSGTVRLITNKPNLDKVGGYLSGTGSTTSHGSGNYNLNGMLNLPIVDDTLGVRVVGWKGNDSGYIDAIRLGAGGNRGAAGPNGKRVNGINDQSVNGIRAAVRWKPAPNLTVDASYTYQSEHADDTSQYTPAGITAYNTSAVPSSAIQINPVQGCDLCNTNVVLLPYEERLRVYNATATYDTAIGSLTATASQFNRFTQYDNDSTPILIAFGVPASAQSQNISNKHSTSAELRYASNFDLPVNFVVGGFYQRTKDDLFVHIVDVTNEGTPAGSFQGTAQDDFYTGNNGHTILGREDHRLTKQGAIFGEATWKITDRLTAIGGLRYFEVKLDGYQIATHPFFIGTEQVPQLNTPTKYHNVSQKFNLSYKFSDAALVYVMVAKGFRSGGLNELGVPGDIIPRSFGPDTLWNYEVGVKGRLGSGVVTYQADAYWIDWSNIQVQAQSANGTDYLMNLGRARVRGVEAQIDVHPIRKITLSAGGSFQDDVLRRGADAADKAANSSLGLSGERLPDVPKWLINGGIDYTRPIGDTKFSLGVDVSYRSGTTAYFASNPNDLPLHGFAQVSLRAGVDWNTWSATVFMRNASNVRGQISATNDTVTPYSVVVIRPRTTGITVTKHF